MPLHLAEWHLLGRHIWFGSEWVIRAMPQAKTAECWPVYDNILAKWPMLSRAARRRFISCVQLAGHARRSQGRPVYHGGHNPHHRPRLSLPEQPRRRHVSLHITYLGRYARKLAASDELDNGQMPLSRKWICGRVVAAGPPEWGRPRALSFWHHHVHGVRRYCTRRVQPRSAGSASRGSGVSDAHRHWVCGLWRRAACVPPRWSHDCSRRAARS